MLKFYSKDILQRYTNRRKGETKFGEVAVTVHDWDSLQQMPQRYVLLGIPEDVGVRANYGISGSSKAWEACLLALCNIQHTPYCKGDSVVVLGEIDCDIQMHQASSMEPGEPHYAEKLGELVSQIDHDVAVTIEKIVAMGKTPIVIGGGHNNSFGNLKGTATALGHPVNCINFDAHTDLRELEHRHSGNGFSFALHDKFLAKYFIFGLHRNYTPHNRYEYMLNHEAIRFAMLEDISVKNTTRFGDALDEAKKFCGDQAFGLEVDLDAIANMGSSAMSPSGFTLEQCRAFINYFKGNDNCKYIHLCEGAPNRELFDKQVGKCLAYLVSDLISND